MQDYMCIDLYEAECNDLKRNPLEFSSNYWRLFGINTQSFGINFLDLNQLFSHLRIAANYKEIPLLVD